MGDISGGSRRLPDGGSLGLAADGRASVSRGDLSRCAEEELAVMAIQFCDTLADVVEQRGVRSPSGVTPIEVAVPTLAKLLQGGDIDGAVVEVLVQRRHVVP